MPPQRHSPKKAAKTPKKRAASKKRPARKMPVFSKPSEATLALFFDAIDGQSDIEHRTMFGYPAAFVNGNMMASVFQDRIMVRLSESDRAEAMKRGARRFEPMPGRPMKEYVELPAVTGGELRLWVSRALTLVRSLPAKTR